MDHAERQRRTEMKKAELVQSLDEHIGALERMDTTTSFNFDIATDIHPELIDNSTPEGRAVLAFWQEVYGTLQEKPKYMAFRRLEVGHKPGVCTSFSSKPMYEISHASIVVIEDPTMEDIQFERLPNKAPRITLCLPSLQASLETIENEDTYTLFETTNWQTRSLPETFFANSDIDFLTQMIKQLTTTSHDIQQTYGIDYVPMRIINSLNPLAAKATARLQDYSPAQN